MTFNPFFIKAGIIAALIAGAYVKGCSDEKERFDDYKSVVKAVGDAQEARTKARIQQQQLDKREADMAHDARVASVRAAGRRDLERLRRDLNARGSVVPAVPGAAEGGDGLLCLEARALDRRMGDALAKLLDGTAGVLQRGEEARANFETCAEWALRQYKERR